MNKRMQNYWMAAVLGAALIAGCGGNNRSALMTATDSLAEAPLGARFDVPPAPPNAGIGTYQNDTLGIAVTFPESQLALFDPPQYVTVLGNRIFELVHRTLPEGAIFRPNVGLIVDDRFQGQPISVESYVTSGLPILQEFFQNFQLVEGPLVDSIEGHEAVTIRFTANWQAPDGTLVAFDRVTLFVENRGNILIFTFTTPPGEATDFGVNVDLF